MKLVQEESKTPEISMEAHIQAEEELNSHALALTRILGLSESKEGDRLRRAVTVVNKLFLSAVYLLCLALALCLGGRLE